MIDREGNWIFFYTSGNIGSYVCTYQKINKKIGSYVCTIIVALRLTNNIW